MIPLRLSLKNFLCYREGVPDLDFAGIHVACLCGSNGHGKSALLDGITWCLWGKARGRTQDELISFGADECRVELEFLARDTQYRVIRSHSRAGARRRQGISDLQLQVIDNGQAQPITGNSVRETQARIERLVGMDYDTFINSAFLLQGRADEFTNKTPADRKAVLAKILGLEAYDRLQARARLRLAGAKTEADRLDGAVLQMRRDAAEMADPSGELAEVAERLAFLERQVAAQRRDLDDLRGKVGELRRQQEELAATEKQLDSSRRDIAQLESAIAAGEGRVAEYRSLLEQSAAVGEAISQLAVARQRYDALEEARRAFDTLNEERNGLVRAIDAQRARLESRLEQFQKDEADLERKAGLEASLVSQRDEASARLAGLDLETRKTGGERQRQQSLSVEVGQARSAAERYLTEGQDLRKKVDLLQVSNQEEALCPLCQTPLGLDGCRRMFQHYETEIQEKRRLYRENQALLQKLEAETATLDRELTRREQDLATARRERQAELDALDRRIIESGEARQALAQLKPQLAEVVASLESGEFASEDQSKLEDVDRKIAALGYDETARQQSYRRMQELLPFEDKRRRLAEAEDRLPGEEASLSQGREMLDRRRRELAQLEERLSLGLATVAKLPRWQAAMGEASETLSGLEREQTDAIARRGDLEGRLRRLESLKQALDGASRRLAVLEGEQNIYQELANAFGRQGAQAMLIESVVPQLEEEANLLLGRMTDNRMHLKLETQRERRSGRGDPIETLEINVSDELGPRSYEMYSGGEAFRVNLALRIALSKVLAQRTGAPLPSLFIDEGFGTQDAAGRERVLDVISAIEDDFDKIIVITHLEDLKDMFPVRIEVQKTGDGSTFWLT